MRKQAELAEAAAERDARDARKALEDAMDEEEAERAWLLGQREAWHRAAAELDRLAMQDSGV